MTAKLSAPSVISVGLILGSARQTGATRKLAAALTALAPRDLSLCPVEIADLPLYHEELELPEPPAAWTRFRAQVKRVDALLFVTPEYNRSIPALLKNAIDIGSSPDESSVWSKKPCAIASHSPGRLGGFGANHHLRQALVFLDMPTLAQPEVYLSWVETLFDAEGQLHDESARSLLSEFMHAFRDWTLRLMPRTSGERFNLIDAFWP